MVITAPSNLRFPLSPCGRGMRSLSERSELRRSWVRGRAAADGCPHSQTAAQRASADRCFGLALLRARAPLGALPLIQLLGSAPPRQGFVSFSRKWRRGCTLVLVAAECVP